MFVTGCPDMYRRYENAHMFQGVLKPYTTLVDCQRACLQERNCLGVDWNKLNSPAGTAADTRRCYFVFPESTRYGVQPSTDYCCDHFRRTYCMSTVVPDNSGVTQSVLAARQEPVASSLRDGLSPATDGGLELAASKTYRL